MKFIKSLGGRIANQKVKRRLLNHIIDNYDEYYAYHDQENYDEYISSDNNDIQQSSKEVNLQNFCCKICDF